MSAGSPVDSGIMGLLLAAGRGRRMGTTKQLLPWPPVDSSDGGQKPPTVVESAFDAIAPHCGQMVVVLGHQAQAVRTVLRDRSFDAVMSDPDAEMIDSIKAGLRYCLLERAMSCVLLHPADHPDVQASTVSMLIQAHFDQPDHAIMPEHQGLGGHPVLIPRSLIDPILAFCGSGGLRAFWAMHPQRCRRLEVDDRQSVTDLDTPEAYEAKRQ